MKYRLAKILFLISMIGVMLTGCGDKDAGNSTKSADEGISSSEEISQSTANASDSKADIFSPKSFIASKNYLVIANDSDIICIMNKDGEITSKINKPWEKVQCIEDDRCSVPHHLKQDSAYEDDRCLSQYNSNNSYVTLEEGFIKIDGTIYDCSDGKAIISDVDKTDDKITYRGIGNHNSMIKVEKKSSLGGDTETVEIMDFNGNSLCKDLKSAEYYGDGIYFCKVGDNKNIKYNRVFNVDTKELKEIAGINNDLYLNDYFADGSKYVGISLRDKLCLVDREGKYYDDYHTYLHCLSKKDGLLWNDNEEWRTVGIYDENFKLVKDLSEGGIKKIGYYNGHTYVWSKTGYYYVLDRNFDYLVKPIKLDGDTDTHLPYIQFLSDNIVLKGNDICDRNLNKIQEVPQDVYYNGEFYSETKTKYRQYPYIYGDRYICYDFKLKEDSKKGVISSGAIYDLKNKSINEISMD